MCRIMSTKTKSTKSKSPKSTAKRSHKRKASTTKAPAKPVAVTTTANPDQMYRPGTMYACLFDAGQDYILKSDLIKKVADLTGKSEKVVGFAFQVLKARHHKSNNGRSALLTDDAGLVKFVKLQK